MPCVHEAVPEMYKADGGLVLQNSLYYYRAFNVHKLTFISFYTPYPCKAGIAKGSQGEESFKNGMFSSFDHFVNQYNLPKSHFSTYLQIHDFVFIISIKTT